MRPLLFVLLPLLAAAKACTAPDDCESGACLGARCCTSKGGLSEGCLRCGSNGGCVRCDDGYDLPGYVCIKGRGGDEQDEEDSGNSKERRSKQEKRKKQKQKRKKQKQKQKLKQKQEQQAQEAKVKEQSQEVSGPEGACSQGAQCASGLCLGGHCCTAAGGLSTGCRKCDAQGGCLRCKKGFSLPGASCVPKKKNKVARELVTTGPCSLDVHCASEICLGGWCCTGKGLSPGCGGCQENGDCMACSEGLELRSGECMPTHVVPVVQKKTGPCTADDDCVHNCRGGKCCTQRGGVGEGCLKCGSNGGCVRCQGGFSLPEFTCVRDDVAYTGPCKAGAQCASGVCRGSKCCTAEGGLGEGCVRCGSNGGCVKCQEGFSLPKFVCQKKVKPATAPQPTAPAPLGPCEADVDCTSGFCRGGHCCTADVGGPMKGCQECDKAGGCALCSKGFSLLNSSCVPRKIKKSAREKVETGPCSLDVHCASEICLSGWCCTGKGLSPGCGGCQENGVCVTCSEGFELHGGECVEHWPERLVDRGSCSFSTECKLGVCKGGHCCASRKCMDRACLVANAEGNCARCAKHFHLTAASDCLAYTWSSDSAKVGATGQRVVQAVPEYVDVFMPHYEGIAVEHAEHNAEPAAAVIGLDGQDMLGAEGFYVVDGQ